MIKSTELPATAAEGEVEDAGAVLSKNQHRSYQANWALSQPLSLLKPSKSKRMSQLQVGTANENQNANNSSSQHFGG